MTIRAIVGAALTGIGDRSARRLFNALNYLGRRGADSTEWADKPGEWSLLNGHGPTRRTSTITFAKVRVAGSNPVVRSTETPWSDPNFGIGRGFRR